MEPIIQHFPINKESRKAGTDFPPLHDECSGMAEINKQLARKLPPLISRVGMFALGMIAGALIVFCAVVAFLKF